MLRLPWLLERLSIPSYVQWPHNLTAGEELVLEAWNSSSTPWQALPKYLQHWQHLAGRRWHPHSSQRSLEAGGSSETQVQSVDGVMVNVVNLTGLRLV